jgi:hypothetical protein
MKLIEYQTNKNSHSAFVLTDGNIIVVPNNSDESFRNVIDDNLLQNNDINEILLPQYFVMSDSKYSNSSFVNLGSCRIPNVGEYMVEFVLEQKPNFNDIMIVYGKVLNLSTSESNLKIGSEGRKPLKIQNYNHEP